MEPTIHCRTCGQTLQGGTRVCIACGVARPGRNVSAIHTAGAIVFLVTVAGGSVWLYLAGRSVQLGISLVTAAALAALLRVLLPVIVRAPRPRPGSLVSRITALEARVSEISEQLESLAEAFDLARERSRSRLIDLTKTRLKRSYTLLKRYRDRFDAQLAHLQFSLWMHETAAIISGWERSDSRRLSGMYSRLIQRTDGVRVKFQPVISGKKTGEVYAKTGMVIRHGLARVDSVADAMVARKALLAMADVSPASLPPEPHFDSIVEELATEDAMRSAEALEREFDRIMAEHELA